MTEKTEEATMVVMTIEAFDAAVHEVIDELHDKADDSILLPLTAVLIGGMLRHKLFKEDKDP